MMPRPGIQASVLLPCLLPLLLLTTPALARTWSILNDGSGDAPTIQAGIDSAADGDTVLVGPGTYLENINFLGKDIVVRSQSGPEVTILDGSSAQESVVLFIGGESRSALLEGFTLMGGTGHIDPRFQQPAGGGIFCGQSSPTIRGNRILQNRVITSKGGGIFVSLPNSPDGIASPMIEQNIIEENHGRNGGGIALDGGHAVIRNNIFRRNTCQGDGGAISAWMLRGSAEIEGNQFWENVAPDHGGAIYASDTNVADYVIIRSNLFVRNEAYGEGAEHTGSGGAVWLNELSGVVENNTMVGNLAYGESSCSGSGILLDRTPADLILRNNIFALGSRCGVECLNLFGPVETIPGPNILWQNTGDDILYGVNHCPTAWSENMIVVDPMFCDPDGDNYTVSVDSPALTGSAPFGVWTTPGCGSGVTVEPSTWGRLKSRYR